MPKKKVTQAPKKTRKEKLPSTRQKEIIRNSLRWEEWMTFHNSACERRNAEINLILNLFDIEDEDELLRLVGKKVVKFEI